MAKAKPAVSKATKAKPAVKKAKPAAAKIGASKVTPSKRPPKARRTRDRGRSVPIVPSEGLSLRDALGAGLLRRREAAEEQEVHRARGRPRSPEAHEAMLFATLELLGEVGFDGLTMEAVASRAGVGKATLYRRWPSKVALVAELLDTVAAAAPVPDTGDTRQDLVLFATNVANGLGHDAYGHILVGIAGEVARNEAMAEMFRDRFLRPRRAVARAVIERGIERGDIRPDLDIEVVLDVGVGPLYYRRLFSGAPIDAAVAEQIVDLLLVGASAR